MCEPEEKGKKLSKRPLSSALHWVLVASVLELIQRPQNYAKTEWRAVPGPDLWPLQSA